MAEKENSEKDAEAKKSQKIRAKERTNEVYKKRAKKLISNLIIIIFIMIIIGVSLTSIGWNYVFYVLLIGLLPGLVANFTDIRPGRFASKTIIAFNLAGLVQPLKTILVAGSPNQAAQSILIDPQNWLLVYGFAAFGWGIVFLLPHIALFYLEIRANYLIKKMKKYQEELLEEWGEDIKK